ncbi:MAG TPA: hypothetical protein VK927_02315 [Adhaeribacter sp.]|nr:hypothetical protein [Adhaeribacter sp.]
MKSLFFILLVAGFTYSCTNGHDHLPANQVKAAPVATDLKLDTDNKKWRADEPTTTTIENMQQLMHTFGTGNNVGSVSAYQELGKTLNHEMNTLFRQCTMTGPAHDELHTILTPIMKDIKVLQGENLEASTAAQMRLEERLMVYNDFFE